MSNITAENLDFDLLFANAVNREDIDEDIYSKGWYSIVGGINGIPTVRQFNALQYISDLKAKYLYYNKLDKDGGEADDLVVAFTRAAQRANIESGESISTLMGKINKYFSDMHTVAFSGKYTDLSGTPSSLKNPSALTVQINDSTAYSYDGSAAKSLNFKAGTNISLSLDANGKLTINSTYSYSHPTGAGYNHVPAGGSSGQWLKWSSAGTATWATLLANNLTQAAAGVYALDSYQGKVLKDLLDVHTADIAQLNTNLMHKLQDDYAAINLSNGTFSIYDSYLVNGEAHIIGAIIPSAAGQIVQWNVPKPKNGRIPFPVPGTSTGYGLVSEDGKASFTCPENKAYSFNFTYLTVHATN